MRPDILNGHGALHPGGLDPRPAQDLGSFDVGAREPLFARVLVGMDGSEGAQAAFSWAARLARDTDARLIAASVRVPAFVPPAEGGPGWWDASIQRRNQADQEALDGALAEIAAIGVDAQSHVDVGAPADRLLWALHLYDADLVVVGASRHPEDGRAGLGRVATLLLRGTTASVLLARGPPRHGSILGFGKAATTAARRLAGGAGMPFLGEAAGEPQAMAARARQVGADLVVLDDAPEAERFATLAPCSVLVLRA